MIVDGTCLAHHAASCRLVFFRSIHFIPIHPKKEIFYLTYIDLFVMIEIHHLLTIKKEDASKCI